MSKCESNVNELIVSDLVGIPGTVAGLLSVIPHQVRAARTLL